LSQEPNKENQPNRKGNFVLDKKCKGFGGFVQSLIDGNHEWIKSDCFLLIQGANAMSDKMSLWRHKFSAK